MAPSKDYDLYEDRGPLLYVSVWTVAAITILALVGRFTARKLKGQRWLIDDWMALVALILALANCICSTIAVSFGIGRHLKALGSSFNPVPFWKLLFVANQVYVMQGPVNKIAVLLMYRRIFDTPLFRRALILGFTICLLWWLGFSITGILACRPVRAYWYQDIEGKKCINLLPYDYAYSIINISLDVFILCLPIREVWRLQLTRSQKVALSLIFLIGAFACVTALIRLLEAILYVNDPDFTWVYLDATLWTGIEPMIAVMCMCLPMLRPVLRKIIPERFALSSFMRSGPRETPQEGTIITIGSFRPNKDKKKDQYGFTAFDDEEGGSQKALHMNDSGRMSSEDLENGISVRRSVELVRQPIMMRDRGR